MEALRILYDSKKSEYKDPFGPLRENEECVISILVPQYCKTKKITLVFENEDGSDYCAFLMKKCGEDKIYEKYSVNFTLKTRGLYFYYFRFETETTDFSLFRQGFNKTNMESGSKWQLSILPERGYEPSGFDGNVMYQIFPDRFNKGSEHDLSNKIKPFSLHSDTTDIPEYRPDENGEVKNCDFFGGDLKGIEEKVDYLASLGVGTVYLNPIFKAWSNHRYDTYDYKKIDELLGDDDDLASLCRALHSRGMKLILDGVFSHTGSKSVYFNDVLSDKNSKYYSWYDFQQYPDKYTSWWGIKTLPCVNELDPGYIDYQITGNDSTLSKWIGLGVDGFRLDVADELPDEFIRKFNSVMKEKKKDSLLIGEVWEDASNKISYSVRKKYFTENELDSVMNYPFRTALIDFVLGNDTGEGLRMTVLEICENYPSYVLNRLMNFLSTHDTQRILTVLSGVYPKTKDERSVWKLGPAQYSVAEKKTAFAYSLLYCLPGCPCIFYGDETGKEGYEDPFCRTYFDWNKKSRLYDLFVSLAEVRSNKELKTGKTEIDLVTNGVIKIRRSLDGKTVSALFNASKKDYRAKIVGRGLFSLETEIDGGDLIMKPYSVYIYR